MEYGNGEVNHLVWKVTSNRYHHEEEGLTLDNPNVNISILGRQVTEDSTVLDIGCGEGKFAKLIKDKKCRVYGIEIDQEAIDYAMSKGNYEDIFNFNIEMPESNDEEYQRFISSNILFDYIAIIDVLEHTINPTKVILEVSKYLKDDGMILISIPNVNNADIVLNLLRGNFNYMQAGILDNTHTKYFTKTSFVEWIHEMNEYFEDSFWDCKYLGGIYGLTDYLEQVKQKMPRVFELIQLNPEYNVIQNLFVLYKRKNSDGVVLLNDLLNEERADLVKCLSDWLEKGIDPSLLEVMGGIRMLPNERNIMEERVRSSEEGWKNCAEELQNALQQIQELDDRYNKILENWKTADQKCQEAIQGWKLSEENRKKAVEEWEKKYQEAAKGWEDTDQKYQEAVKGWEDTDKKYQEIVQKWKEIDERCQVAVKNWEDIDRKYQEVVVSWENSEKKYQEAMQGWQAAEARYQEAMDGWKKCDENYQKVVEELKRT